MLFIFHPLLRLHEKKQRAKNKGQKAKGKKCGKGKASASVCQIIVSPASPQIVADFATFFLRPVTPAKAKIPRQP
jgi:hypothetical protein